MPVLNDDLSARLLKAVEDELSNVTNALEADYFAEVALKRILPLVRAEIAAAEHRGAERAAHELERNGYLRSLDNETPARVAARVARAAVPAPTGDNA
jgi:hypothetical protein